MPGRVPRLRGIRVRAGVVPYDSPGFFNPMATPKYYRNTVEINDIEPGALWVFQNGICTLVDGDQFVQVPFDDSNFVL